MAEYWQTHGEREILFRIGQAIIPQGRVFPPFTREAVLRGEQVAGSLPASVRQAVRTIIWLIEMGSIPRYGRRMSSLKTPDRLHYLRTWSQGNAARRAAFRYITLPQKVFYYDDPDKFEMLGVEYRKPPVQDESPRWMANVTPGSDLTEDLEIETEVVVVGTGAGGAAAACALAEKGDTVVIVEEGHYHRRSAFSGRPFEMQSLMYRGVGGIAMTLGNPPIFLPTGCCVGGTTTINSGTCFRTPSRTLKRWRDLHGLAEYTDAAMAPYFDRVEAEYQVETAKMEYVGKSGEILARGAEKLGYSHGPLDRCAPDCDGQGICSFGCNTGAKRSTDVSFVPRALRNNAQLLTGVRVDYLLVKDGQVLGVSGVSLATGTAVTIRASVVVLAMGTLMTPLFLRRHGVGNSSGQLGRNVSIHPANGVTALMDEVVDGWKCIPQGYMVDQFESDGIVIEGAFAPLDSSAVLNPMIGTEFQDMMENYRHLAVSGFMIEDDSRGTVHNGMNGQAMLAYNVVPSDCERIVRAFSILTRIYLAAGARKVWAPVHGWSPMAGFDDLVRNLERDVRPSDLELSAFHPLGSCHMGSDPTRHVCTPEGELHDLGNVFICDGAAIPPALGVNPMVTISAVAMRMADRIHDRING